MVWLFLVEEEWFSDMEYDFFLITSNCCHCLSPFQRITKQLFWNWTVKITYVKLNKSEFCFVLYLVKPLDHTDGVLKLQVFGGVSHNHHNFLFVIKKWNDWQYVLKQENSIFTKLVNWKQVFEWKCSPIGHYFSFKKISQWKDIRNW